MSSIKFHTYDIGIPSCIFFCEVHLLSFEETEYFQKYIFTNFFGVINISLEIIQNFSKVIITFSIY